MGADEVACDDVYNERDWNGDGVVNLEEWYVFASAWLTRDPNDPGLITDANDPGYIEPNSVCFANWNETCDFDCDYIVDVNDIEIFCGEWLWQACWRTDDVWTMMSMGGGLEVGKVMSAQSEAASSSELAALASVKVAPKEPTIEEQIVQTEDIIDWLEKLWEDDEDVGEAIDDKDWEVFMKKIYDWLEELEAL